MGWPKKTQTQTPEVITRTSPLTKQGEGVLANTLVGMVLSGMSRSRMVRALQSQFEGLSDELIDHFIRLCMEQIADDVSLEISNNFKLAIARRLDLREKAYAEMDWKTCLLIDQDLAKLQGLYEQNPEQSGSSALSALITGLDKVARARLEAAPTIEAHYSELPQPDEDEDEGNTEPCG